MPYDLFTWQPLSDADLADRAAISSETNRFLGELGVPAEQHQCPVEAAEELLSSTLLELCRELASAVIQEETRKAAHRQAVARLQSRPRLQNQPVSRGDRSFSRPLP